MSIELNTPIPEFASLQATSDKEIMPSSLKGQFSVLYFYPKDNTPGCTTESIDFTNAAADFDAVGTDIVGVSADSVKKHENFIAKHNLGIPLLADEEQTMLNAYGVWVEKNMYGRKFMGIERATYLIAADGTIKQIWRKVKVKGHVEAVLEAASN